MSILTKEQFDKTQAYIDYWRAQLQSIGLNITPHDNLEEWKALIASAPGAPSLSKPFDLSHSYIQPGDAFWFSLDDASNQQIACVGARVFETQDFIQDYVTTYLLYGNRLPRLEAEPYEFVGTLPIITGRIGYGGGSWVHPDWRGRDLSVVTSKLGRVLAVRHLRADAYTCFIKTARKPWSTQTLGWPHRRALTTGYHPGRDNYIENGDFLWTYKEEIIDLCDERMPLTSLNHQRRHQRTA